MALGDLAVDVAREFALELGVDELLLEDEQGLAQPVVDHETLQDVLQLADFARRYGRGEIGQFVRLVKDVGCDLVDGEVGDLIAEERVELGDVLEDGDDFGHEGADVLVVFVVGQRDEVFDLDDGDVVFVQEGRLHRAWVGLSHVCAGGSWRHS